MLNAALPVLFESSDNSAVRQDPANEDWLVVVDAVCGGRYQTLARRYYVALYHFRRQGCRPALPGSIQLEAQGKQQAWQQMLGVLEQRKSNRKQTADVFVDARPDSTDQRLPEVLKDFSKAPLSLHTILSGPGRPPCDALCLMRAFFAAPLLGVGDDPTSVYRLLHSNPTFAHACDFLGRDVLRQPGELTSRRLPSLSVCEELSEVMRSLRAVAARTSRAGTRQPRLRDRQDGGYRLL